MKARFPLLQTLYERRPVPFADLLLYRPLRPFIHRPTLSGKSRVPLPNWPPSTRNSQGRGREGILFLEHAPSVVCGLRDSGGESDNRPCDWTLGDTSTVIVFSTTYTVNNIVHNSRMVRSSCTLLATFHLSLNSPSLYITQVGSRAAAQQQVANVFAFALHRRRPFLPLFFLPPSFPLWRSVFPRPFVSIRAECANNNLAFVSSSSGSSRQADGGGGATVTMGAYIYDVRSRCG